MKQLSSNLVEIIKAEMKGKKLEKFLESVRILNASAEQGGWIEGGSRRASSGFYQGSGIRMIEDAASGRVSWKNEAFSEAMFSLHYGNPVKNVDAAVAVITKEELKKFSREYARAWMLLSTEARELSAALDKTRPLPKITKVGLSPKVTKTLQECNLDLDLSTITYPELETFEMEVLVPVKNKKTGEVEMKWVMQEFQRPVWPKGTVHNQSRFAMNTNGCHACGKNIPSGRFVPFYAEDKKSGKKVSMWVGCDCAKKLFGIKDVGVAREENLKKKGA